MNYLPESFQNIAGSVAGAETSTGSPAASTGGILSSWFGTNAQVTKKEEQLDGVANGENGVANGENGVQAGGKRKSKRQCGGSFRPYTPSSDLSSTASSFKGGRRRKTRKSYKKKSRRKSHRKRR